MAYGFPLISEVHTKNIINSTVPKLYWIKITPATYKNIIRRLTVGNIEVFFRVSL